MTEHERLHAAVMGLVAEYSAASGHTNENRTTRRDGSSYGYYHAQIWFSTRSDGCACDDCVSANGDTVDGTLIGLRHELTARDPLPAHPMARHAAMLERADRDGAP